MLRSSAALRSPAAPRRSRVALVVLAGLLSLLTGIPGSAFAADLPADVVTDGTVTVVVSDPQASGAPLEGVTVILTAQRPDLVDDPVIQELTGLTGADGHVVFDGVARPADGAPPVILDAQAAVEIPTDCGSQRWTGAGTALAAATVDLPVAIDAGDASCVARVIEGVVLDAEGSPMLVASAIAVIASDGAPTETQAVEVGPDGAFAIVLEAVGDVTVGLTVESPVMTVPGAPGCVLQVVERAVADWDLPAGASVPEQIVVAERVVLASTCGTTGTPGPDAPALTLPPTDGSIGTMAVGPSPMGLVLAVLGSLLVAAGVTAEVRRRRS
jgi:hypothetical protein